MSLRYFNVAGASGDAGEDHHPETHLIPLVLQAAAGTREAVSIFGTDYPTPDGTAIRDYIHIEDLAEAHLLGTSPPSRGPRDLQPRQRHGLLRPPGHRGGPRGHGPRDPGPRGGPRRAGDPAVLVAASAKVREGLGWSPRKPELEAMIGDAWAWSQANPGGYGA